MIGSRGLSWERFFIWKNSKNDINFTLDAKVCGVFHIHFFPIQNVYVFLWLQENRLFMNRMEEVYPKTLQAQKIQGMHGLSDFPLDSGPSLVGGLRGL